MAVLVEERDFDDLARAYLLRAHGDVNDNDDAVHQALELGAPELAEVARNAFAAGRLPEPEWRARAAAPGAYVANRREVQEPARSRRTGGPFAAGARDPVELSWRRVTG